MLRPILRRYDSLFFLFRSTATVCDCCILCSIRALCHLRSSLFNSDKRKCSFVSMIMLCTWRSKVEWQNLNGCLSNLNNCLNVPKKPSTGHITLLRMVFWFLSCWFWGLDFIKILTMLGVVLCPSWNLRIYLIYITKNKLN